MRQHREPLAGLRILVVEDKAVVAMLVEEMLQELRCTIVGPFSTVEPAVAAIRRQPIDGALLDINLQGQTVLPAAEELQQRGIPFLLVTGYASQDGDPPALRRAPRLRKPFNLTGLSAAMAAVFTRPATGT